MAHPGAPPREIVRRHGPALTIRAIIANLLAIPGYYDVALRDFGLSLGALALSRLSVEFGR